MGVPGPLAGNAASSRSRARQVEHNRLCALMWPGTWRLALYHNALQRVLRLSRELRVMWARRLCGGTVCVCVWVWVCVGGKGASLAGLHVCVCLAPTHSMATPPSTHAPLPGPLLALHACTKLHGAARGAVHLKAAHSVLGFLHPIVLFVPAWQCTLTQPVRQRAGGAAAGFSPTGASMAAAAAGATGAQPSDAPLQFFDQLRRRFNVGPANWDHFRQGAADSVVGEGGHGGISAGSVPLSGAHVALSDLAR